MAAWGRLLRKEMEFERAFFAAGGRLLAGVDPTGWGGLVAGFGNQRQVELLVAAGLRPEEAIRVASANGAYFLEDDLIGTVTAGLQADLFVVSGNPATNISDIRNVEIVFKKGMAYDPAKLIAATQGTVGRFDHLDLLPFALMAAGWPRVAARDRDRAAGVLTPAQILGSVTSCCFRYFPFLSAYEISQGSSLWKNSTWAMPSLA